MEDIRELEEETKRELDEERAKVKTTGYNVVILSITFQGELKGTAALDD